MSSRAMIDAFMAEKKLALIRSSRKSPVRGFSIDKELRARGYTVSVVYLDEESSAGGLSGLKEPVGGMILAVPTDQTDEAARRAIEAGVRRVWMQKGSETQAAIQLCEKNGIPVIQGECGLARIPRWCIEASPRSGARKGCSSG